MLSHKHLFSTSTEANYVGAILLRQYIDQSKLHREYNEHACFVSMVWLHYQGDWSDGQWLLDEYIYFCYNENSANSLISQTAANISQFCFIIFSWLVFKLRRFLPCHETQNLMCLGCVLSHLENLHENLS